MAKPDAEATAAWQRLDCELQAWRGIDAYATFWWRDDDVTHVTPAFERLVEISRRHGAPLLLAAIPAQIDTGLAAIVFEVPTVAVMQHGHAHVDLSAASRPGHAELSDEVPVSVVMDRLARGRERLRFLFGERFVPAVAPPWNRVDDAICERLPEFGFHGVSTFGPRAAAEPYAGLRQVNTHCDIIDWKRGGRFRGVRRAVDDIVEHLSARRVGVADFAEPTGILTHHLDHDDGCWTFLEALIRFLSRHPTARLMNTDIFGN